MYGYPSCLLLSFNTLYLMLMLWLNVNTFISSKKIKSVRINEQRAGDGTASIAIRIAKVRADGNNAYFQEVWRLYT